MRPARLVGVLAAAGALLPGLAIPGPYDRLLDAILHDDAYKVRMKAIRVVVKRVKKQPGPAPAAVIDALTQAATKDEAYLVRGMACVAFGQITDPRGAPALKAALQDEEAFVRAQAESALQKIEPPRVAPSQGGLLVVAVEATPGGPGVELLEPMLGFLKDELSTKAPGRRVATSGAEPGHLLTGTVARLASTPSDGGKVRLTAEVKLTVATWPARNLRHVMSAKAGATVTPTQDSLRLRKKLVRAALARAVSDALGALGGE